MKKGFSRNIVHILFITLIFFKVSSFHAYEHKDACSDDIEKCSLCDLAIENQNPDFLFTAEQTVPLPVVQNAFHLPKVTNDVLVTTSFLRFCLFGRPPPTVV